MYEKTRVGFRYLCTEKCGYATEAKTIGVRAGKNRTIESSIAEIGIMSRPGNTDPCGRTSIVKNKQKRHDFMEKITFFHKKTHFLLINTNFQ